MRSLLSSLFLFIVACSNFAHRSEFVGLESVPESPEEVIVDSDGAVFWDDGAALALLLQHPKKIRILGLTTVIGNNWPYQAAEYLGRVLKLASQTNIPIYIGADEPLKNSHDRMNRLEKNLIGEGIVAKQGFWKGAYSRKKEIRRITEIEPVKGEALSGVKPQSESAVDFIVQTLLRANRPVTFVAIGPLTNLASALQKNPRIVAKIRRLLIMGGALKVPGNTTPYAELNFLFDPEAAQIVLASAIREKILFPLDLSNQGVINKERYIDIVRNDSPYTSLLKADRGPHFDDPNYSVQAWDTAVAAYLIDPNYITEFEDVPMGIVTAFGPRYGSVQLSSTNMNLVRVATKMDVTRFFQILKNDLGRRPVEN